MVAAPLLDSSSGWEWTVSSRNEVSDMGGSQSFRAGGASSIVAEPTDDQRVETWQRHAGPRRSRRTPALARGGSWGYRWRPSRRLRRVAAAARPARPSP